MSNLRPYGHHTITPSFVVPGVGEVITFLEEAFDAKVVDRYDFGGETVHAELLIRDSVVMCGVPMPGWEPTPAVLALYVDDADAVDATYRRALAAGAASLEEPNVKPWGYRSASIKDPGGNRWTISTVVEVVPPAELQRRMAEMMK